MAVNSRSEGEVCRPAVALPSGSGYRPAALRRPRTARRGMLLLVVLAIIAVLSLIAVSFSYRMEAERRGITALGDLQQARVAAESGLARVLLLLRDERTDMDRWYNNPESFRKVPIYAPNQAGGSESEIYKEPIEGRNTWRYSVVASEELGQDRVKMRYGLTDEASKVNLNTASRGQLLRLFSQLELKDLTPDALADALIDWRDKDDNYNSIYGAESSYYMMLNPQYRAKNRPFETVEELLMVRHFTGRILYGEDFNRNGYLDENEDDGDEGAFPPDNGDGILDRGLLPFITVHSWDWNFANDNKKREDINKLSWDTPDNLPQHIQDEVAPEVMQYLADVKAAGFKFRSVGEIWELEVYEDGTSNHDALWRQYRRQVRQENRVSDQEDDVTDTSESTDGGNAADSTDNGDGSSTGEDASSGDGNTSGSDRNAGGANDTSSGSTSGDDSSTGTNKNSRRRQQSIRGSGSGGGRSIRLDSAGGSSSGGTDRGGRDRANNNDGNTDRRGNTAGTGGRDGTTGTEGDVPEDKGPPIPNPITPEQLDILMDRLTATPQPAFAGLINVNTAPAQVLHSVIGLTEEQVASIIAQRSQMSSAEKRTPAWVATSGAVDADTFAVVSNKLTARSIQFTADVIGFSDQGGTMRRIQAVIEMRGHTAQIRYYRDISGLGIGYPVKDDERSEGLAYRNR